MNEERISRIFHKRLAADQQVAEVDLSGFTANPFASLMSPAQAQLYQAAFLKAQRDVQEEAEWPMAEYWN